MSNLYIVIIGCGRLGSYLASQLSREGNSVVVIARDEESFNNLSPEFSGFRIEGDATQMAVLEEARLKKADILIAVSHEDNINLMVAQVARKIFAVPRVVARVFDPAREEICSQLGISTICPTSVAAEMFLNVVKNSETRHKGVAA